jgi:hypothetical protein
MKFDFSIKDQELQNIKYLIDDPNIKMRRWSSWDSRYAVLEPEYWIKSRDQMRLARLDFAPDYEIYNVGIREAHSSYGITEHLLRVNLRESFYEKVKYYDVNKFETIGLEKGFVAILSNNHNYEIIDCDLLFQDCGQRCLNYNYCYAYTIKNY